MQRLLEIQSGGRQRSPALIEEDARLMDRLQKRTLAVPQVRLSQDSPEETRFQGLAGRSESRQAQTLERGASRSSTDVRHDNQFKNCDIREFNLKFLDLACCLRGTEIPLLAHNFSKRASAIWRPSQDELLGTLCLGFFEDERDACESLRLVED